MSVPTLVQPDASDAITVKVDVSAVIEVVTAQVGQVRPDEGDHEKVVAPVQMADIVSIPPLQTPYATDVAMAGSPGLTVIVIVVKQPAGVV